MSRLQIELTELNRLYDEIYYGNFESVEVALDIVSNIISEKELEDEEDLVFGLSNIVDVIVKTLDEIAEIFDSESLYDVSYFVKEKTDKIQSGESDALIESTYINYLSEDYDEDFDAEELYELDEDYDEDDIYEDDY